MTRLQLAGLVVALSVLAGGGLGVLASLAAGGREQATPRVDDLRLAGPQRQSAMGNSHGQASWSPGERPAPEFSLRDQNGRRVSLASLRRRPVLLTFFDSECREQCPVAGRQLAIMLREMAPADRPTVVVVSVNPTGDTPASIRHAMASWQLAGPWRWHWLRGTRTELARVWRDFGITVQPTTNDVTHGLTLYLIDRRGFERAGYLFPFLPNFVALDLEKLARE